MAVRLLSRKSVAGLMDVSEKTVRRMVDRGEFPAPVYLPSGDARWLSVVVEGWLLTRPNAVAVKEIPPGQSGTLRDTTGQIEAPPSDSKKRG